MLASLPKRDELELSACSGGWREAKKLHFDPKASRFLGVILPLALLMRVASEDEASDVLKMRSKFNHKNSSNLA